MSICQTRPTGDEENQDESGSQPTQWQEQTPCRGGHSHCGTWHFDPSTVMEIVSGVHFAVEFSVINCVIADVVATD